MVVAVVVMTSGGSDGVGEVEVGVFVGTGVVLGFV